MSKINLIYARIVIYLYICMMISNGCIDTDSPQIYLKVNSLPNWSYSGVLITNNQKGVIIPGLGNNIFESIEITKDDIMINNHIINYEIKNGNILLYPNNIINNYGIQSDTTFYQNVKLEDAHKTFRITIEHNNDIYSYSNENTDSININNKSENMDKICASIVSRFVKLYNFENDYNDYDMLGSGGKMIIERGEKIDSLIYHSGSWSGVGGIVYGVAYCESDHFGFGE